MGNCDHAISVPDCAYEIGVLEVRCAQGGKKFVLAYDYWPSGGLHTKMPTKAGDPNPFAQAYAIEAAKAQAITEGLQRGRSHARQQHHGTHAGDYR